MDCTLRIIYSVGTSFCGVTSGTEYVSTLRTTDTDNPFLVSDIAWVTGITKPAPPDDVYLKPGNPPQTVVNVTWTEPDWGYGGYNHSEITCVGQVGHNYMTRVPNGVTTAACTGLTPGDIYIVTVTTIRYYEQTKYTAGETRVISTEPNYPTNAAVESFTPKSIEVSWIEPVDTRYEKIVLTCLHINGSSHGSGVALPGNTTVVCTGLMPESEYALTLCTHEVGDIVTPACADPPLPNVTTDKDVEAYSMAPVFGPISGGTLLIIDGQSLQYVTDISLGEIETNFTIINSNQIHVMTPAVPSDIVGYHSVTLTTVDGDQVLVPETYDYRPDPIIVWIDPLETIARGGTMITVDGSYLNSIARPFIDVTLVNRTSVYEQHTAFQSLCYNTTNSRMLCRTPDLTIEDTPYTETENGTISSPELVFYLGFTLDGVDDYTNISEAEGLEQYGILTVYGGPSLGTADGLITYQEGVLLHVEGTDMTSGISMTDYVVDVETGICVNQDLTDNELICTPPGTPPEKHNETESEYHRIIVHVGSNIDHYYGEMFYPKNINELAIIVGSVVGAVLLIAVLVVVSFLVIRYKKKADDPHETHQEEPRTSEIVEFPPVVEDTWNNLSVDPKTSGIEFPPVVQGIQNNSFVHDDNGHN